LDNESLRPAPQPFLEKATDPIEASYILLGAPLDCTASYRRVSRFVPAAIRRKSAYLEAYSLWKRLDWDDLNLSDLGDLPCDDVERAR